MDEINANKVLEGGNTLAEETPVYATLIVSHSSKIVSLLSRVLPPKRYFPVVTVPDAAKAREQLAQAHFDIAIVNDPLPDISGEELAQQMCENSGVGVLLLVRSEDFSAVNQRVSPHGVLTLPKPTSETMIAQSLLLLCGTRERLRKLEQRAVSMEEKMVEIRIVNRAKCLLIEQLRMTEEEAHRYIEKQAMDRCVTKRTVAENILSTYK